MSREQASDMRRALRVANDWLKQNRGKAPPQTVESFESRVRDLRADLAAIEQEQPDGE